MPEHTHPHIFRLPTALDWPETEARLLSKVDALAPDETLVARFFVDDVQLAHIDITTPTDAGAATSIARETRRRITSDPAYRGPRDWAFHGAADLRTMPTALVSPDRIGQAAGSAALSPYDDHRTRADLARMLHYVHYIPVGRGITDAYVDKNYSGRTWQGLVMVLKAAGIFVGRGSMPPACLPTVRALHFTDATRWCVEWEDGSASAA